MHSVLVSGAQKVIQSCMLSSNYFPLQNLIKYQTHFPVLCSRFLFSSSFVFFKQVFTSWHRNLFNKVSVYPCVLSVLAVEPPTAACAYRHWARYGHTSLSSMCVRSPQFMLTLLTSIQGLERLPWIRKWEEDKTKWDLPFLGEICIIYRSLCLHFRGRIVVCGYLKKSLRYLFFL